MTLPPHAPSVPSSEREGAVPDATAVDLSLVVPAYDEEGNLALLYERITTVFSARADWELVLVDDGSRDRTPEIMRQLAQRDPRVVAVLLEKNCGQTAALSAGIEESRGRLIATLDADLQNDPGDIPKLLENLGDNDAIVGYRERRNDSFVRRASSRIANWVRNRLTGDQIRDTGCSLKLFRSEAVRAIPWFEGMHRFLPTLLRYQGFRVIEIAVSHHPRHAGISKYGIRNRAWRAFKDLLAVRWMRGRTIHPTARGVFRAR